MQQSTRWVLIGVGAALLVAVAVFVYQALSRPEPRDADLVAQAEAACLSNTRDADKAEVLGSGAVKADKAEGSAGVGTTVVRDRGSNRDLDAASQQAENDKIRACMERYLLQRRAPGG
ncbi:MAG: hypothetical protein JNK30_19005 [Phenylobacterium sp.]|uniref:hypothetical protein n=1 Tax=Phenylobacterium sp. TaxID=1871053 RepID=UPI001A4AFBEF|nr:hypothetical protein [Phenylobacterium sp.]MBL8773482.1 hypothetical protein [Phenylobacterium sp.]